MKKFLFKIVIASFLLLMATGCTTDETVVPKSVLPVTVLPETVLVPIPTTTPQTPAKEISFLALGDSYTIGQSVCERADFQNN